MWLMLQQPMAEDYVIATGKSHSLRQFVEYTFDALGLDWQVYVDIDDSLRRPADIVHSIGSPAKAERILQWRAKHGLRDVIQFMIAGEQERPWPVVAS